MYRVILSKADNEGYTVFTGQNGETGGLRIFTNLEEALRFITQVPQLQPKKQYKPTPPDWWLKGLVK